MSCLADKTGNIDYGKFSLSEDIEASLSIFQEIFSEDSTFQYRYLGNRSNSGVRCAVLFLDGMCDTRIINEDIIEPIISAVLESAPNLTQKILDTIIAGNTASRDSDIQKIADQPHAPHPRFSCR